MDERLEKALEFANFMVTLNNQKRSLQEKYQTDCVYYHSGGTFKIDKSLITFVKTLIDLGNIKNIVLIDDNELPIRVDDLTDFLDNIVDQYFISTNNYFNDYQSLKKSRSVKALMNE
jgi:hypothetical protein